jgi:hypothetical protein
LNEGEYFYCFLRTCCYWMMSVRPYLFFPLSRKTMRKEPSGTVDSGTVAARLLPPAQRWPLSQPDARVFRHQPNSTRPGLRHLTVRARLGLLFTLALNWEKREEKKNYNCWSFQLFLSARTCTHTQDSPPVFLSSWNVHIRVRFSI